MSDREVKQVIVIRKDLKMRRGKEIAQGAHASMMWLMERVIESRSYAFEKVPVLSEAEDAWLQGHYRKVVCQAMSEKQLRDLAYDAQTQGLKTYLVTDLGLTEFAGVPTVTALAIGPDWSDRIDPITSGLKLY